VARFLGFRRAVMSRPARRPITAHVPSDATTSLLLRKDFGARLDPDRTVLSRPTGRARPTCTLGCSLDSGSSAKE